MVEVEVEWEEKGMCRGLARLSHYFYHLLPKPGSRVYPMFPTPLPGIRLAL